MGLTSLRESVSRSKVRLKEWFHIGSNDSDHPTTTTQTTTRPGKGSMTWPGIKTLLAVLESSADAFGPLKSAIGGLNKCISIYESACKGREDYVELHHKLDGLMNDLAGYVDQPMGLEMTECVKQLFDGIQLEVEKLKEKQEESMARQLAGAMSVKDEIYECYRRIHGHLERLTMNATIKIADDVNKVKMGALLTEMLPAKSAMYDSAEGEAIKRGRCAPGTREPQIDLLMEWARNPDTGRTCWMNGMAGTGKTTIAYTLCNKLNETAKLGASFFCSREIPECRQVKHIIPSIAYQLARYSLPFQYALVKVLEESNQDTHARGLKDQYQKLIIDPLQAALKSLPPDIIVVVDALDECESEDSVGQVLDLLLSIESTLPLRFLMSSRPEPGIIQRMMGRADKPDETPLVLHNLDSESVQADIQLYMRHELGDIGLSDEHWVGLLERCGVLFIAASTACRYIQLAQHANDEMILDEAVRTIIGSAATQRKYANEESIDKMYSAILTAAFNKFKAIDLITTRMHHVLQTVICAIGPITVDALAGLLDLKSVDQVHAVLQPLRSVLNVTESNGRVSTLHASFPDFMISPERSEKFCCVRESRHADLAKACLQLIDRAEPKFNICHLPSSHLLDDEIEHRDNRNISAGLSYACRYWSDHLSLGENRDELKCLVHILFSARLLLWMEVLNLTGNMRHGTSIVREAELWLLKRTAPVDDARLAHDAWQFVSVYANHPVSASTPHIYVSMLPFWPESRPVSQVYMPRTIGMIQAAGTAITRRQLSLLATWRVSDETVYSMSLSSDGTRIAARTEDTIELLDTSTGDGILSLTTEHRVLSVAISPNGTQVYFCCNNSSVYLWDTRNGGKVTELLSPRVSEVRTAAFSPDLSYVAYETWNGGVYICSLWGSEMVLGPLKGRSAGINLVSFSPDGLHIASGSKEGMICIWKTATGDMVGNPLKGHTDEINSISYSPDGSRLASASHNHTIRVWDSETGKTVLGPLEGHSGWVMSVVFSPNGRFLASGSRDQTIRVYDALTGQTVLGPLQGHTEWVHSVIFSPDSARLFSCSSDGTIRTWNVQDMHIPGVLQNVPSLSSGIACVRYSHSGSRIVSGSDDGSIHIWDVQTGEMVLGPLLGHTDWIRSLDYSPNDAYIASASNDGTLGIWDACDGRDMHGPIGRDSGGVNSVRFSPDSSVVASGSDDGTVVIWDVTSGQLVTKLLEANDHEKNRDGIGSLNFSPDGQHLVCGSHNGILRVLDRHTGQMVLSPLKAHGNVVSSVEFSPDGSRIVSGSWDKSVRIWDVQTGQQILGPSEHSLKHVDYVRSASFSPDGHFIVSCSDDKTIRIWDAQTGNLVFGPLEGHTGWVRSLQFSPDGSHVVSCSYDRTIRFWDVSSCRTKAQESEGQGRTDGPGQPSKKGCGLWSLDSDGWVVDNQQRRLVWVPSDLQSNVLPASNDSVINYDKPRFVLDFNSAKIGEEWTDCYRP